MWLDADCPGRDMQQQLLERLPLHALPDEETSTPLAHVTMTSAIEV